MITYLSKFIPNFSSLTALLRELLKKDVWHWSSDSDKANDNIKKVIPQEVTLSYFDSVSLSSYKLMLHPLDWVRASCRMVSQLHLPQGH